VDKLHHRETPEPLFDLLIRNYELVAQPLQGPQHQSAVIRNAEEVEVEPEGTAEPVDPVGRGEGGLDHGAMEPGAAHGFDCSDFRAASYKTG